MRVNAEATVNSHNYRITLYIVGLVIIKPILVATSIKQTTCIKQAYIHFSKRQMH